MTDESLITISVNRSVLKHFTPSRSFLYGMICYFVIFIISPITLDTEYSLRTAFYIILCSLSFYCGGLIFSYPKENVVLSYSKKDIDNLFSIIMICSIVGTLTKFFDTFFIRGISFSQDVFSNREISGEQSANPIAIVAAFFMYAPFVLIAFTYCFENYFSLSKKNIVLVIFACQFLYPILMGSRSAILYPAVFFISLIIYCKKISFSFKFKTIAIGILVLIAGCIISGRIYSNRLALTNSQMAVSDATLFSGAASTVPSTKEARDLIDSLEDHPVSQNFVLGYVNFCQYYLHGIFECDIQKKFIDREMHGAHSNGQYMFGIYTKFINKILNREKKDIVETYFVHPGIFCSIWGSIYTDFGWFGIIVMFIWGYIQKAIWQKTWKTGNVILLTWLFLGGMVIFLFPLLNLFPGTLCYGFTFVVMMYFMCPFEPVSTTVVQDAQPVS